MASLIHATMGGVRFIVSGHHTIRLTTDSPAYRPFVTEDAQPSGSVSIRIRLHVTRGSKDPPKNREKRFDSGYGWSMSRLREKVFISLHPPAFRHPLWLAEMSEDLTEGTLHCSDILLERRDNPAVAPNPIYHPLDQILLMHVLGLQKGALIHAAGATINGRGLIFPGKSGAGKTTLSRQLIHRKEVSLLSDDRMVVREIDGAFKCFGTPWPGEAGIAVNQSASLSGIVFLEHGSVTELKTVRPQQALERLLPVTSIPWYDTDMIPPMLDDLEELTSCVPAYELSFHPGKEVADVLGQSFVKGGAV